MIFHVTSLPHTQTTLEYDSCAYTAKARKFCNMMKDLGHTVYLYASEENEANVDELITVATKEEQLKWFGERQPDDQYVIDWDASAEHWAVTNARTVQEIEKRAGDRDFICVIAGSCHKPIADAFPALMTVEYGIGYRGVFSKYKVFESYAHMHWVYGRNHSDNGQFFDCVIPNYFELENFPFSEEKDDYYLFMGRMIRRKGPDIAADITRKIGAKLIMAGQGGDPIPGGGVILDRGAKDRMEIHGDHIELVGHADVPTRAKLMSRAKALIAPTTYLEPFGGVTIEALLCGTPVIATDFGAFPENIRHGIDGYRMRTIGEGVWAAKNVDSLNRVKIAQDARARFSTDAIKYQYEAYFQQLLTLWGEGFNSDWDYGVSTLNRYV